MMSAQTVQKLEPAAMAAFLATLANLPEQEIRNAKRLYVLNAIADFEAESTSGRGMLFLLGVMSIFLVFIPVFIAALISYRAGVKAAKQKIKNAIEVWKDDFAGEYPSLLARVEAL
jgi:hypothetical protein